MNLLLDTCTFLWAILAPQSLSPKARDLITDPDHEVFLSAVSMWEILVKTGLGALSFSEPAEDAVVKHREAHGFSALALEEGAVAHLPKLPAVHRDPFDRMLVCQAVHHGLVIVTPDPMIARYPVRITW